MTLFAQPNNKKCLIACSQEKVQSGMCSCVSGFNTPIIIDVPNPKEEHKCIFKYNKQHND